MVGRRLACALLTSDGLHVLLTDQHGTSLGIVGGKLTSMATQMRNDEEAERIVNSNEAKALARFWRALKAFKRVLAQTPPEVLGFDPASEQMAQYVAGLELPGFDEPSDDDCVEPMTKTPIKGERFMALEGLIQWTQAVVTQSARVSAAKEKEIQILCELPPNPAKNREAVHAFQAECHFFAVAACNLLKFQDRVLALGLCRSVDFGEIDGFNKQHIKDVRDMGEHVAEYFAGGGNERARWVFEAPDGSKADASAVSVNMIGGRLDFIKFGAAAERLLPKLLAEPIPYAAFFGEPG
jgi:hypothetical protein